MIPFRVTFRPGGSLYEQVVYAAKKAIAAGSLRPGDPFPSVRTLSSELKINPNTAHKVVTQLTAEGLLETRAGSGAVVAQPPPSTTAQRSQLLDRELEELVVEARQLSLGLAEVVSALAAHWARFDNAATSAPQPKPVGEKR